MKHALVVSYHFPPAGGVPVRRALRFLRHLPRHGFRCTVLTADHPFDPYHGEDPSGLEHLPPTEAVLRAPARSGFERLLARGFATLETARAGGSTSGRGGPAGGRLRGLLHETLACPDPKRPWVRGAVRLALAAAERDPFDVIFATGFPWSAYVVADRLGRTLRRPFVVDLRDAWTLNPRGFWSGPRNRALEAAIVGRAATVVAVTDWIRDGMRARHSGVSPDRFVTITNGFDPAELPPPDPACADPDHLVLTYTGTFNDHLPPSAYDRTPYYLIEAVRLLAPADRALLRVRLVGRVGDAYRDQIARRAVSDVFEVSAPVPHRRALQLQAAADALLLVLSTSPGSAGDMTGKLFEYAGSRRPVLALAPDGEAAKLVRERHLGWVEPPEDAPRIAARLGWLAAEWRAGRLAAPTAGADALSVETLTGQLAAVLERACAPDPRPG